MRRLLALLLCAAAVLCACGAREEADPQPLAEAADAALVRKVVANLAVDQEGADPRSIVQLCIAPRDRAAVKRMHRAPTGLHVRLDSGERRTHKVEEDHVVRQGEAGTLPGAPNAATLPQTAT